MFFLHASNRTENLLRQLAALIEADPLNSIFDQEYILIQSQGMERMISQYMADYFTVWCNYRFFLPITFLQSVAEKLSIAITPDGYERGLLTWRIEDKLRSIDSKVYNPLKQYLQGDNCGLKRFQLARQLANILDQYQLMRPQLLKSWERGILTTKDDAEPWQMDLWRRVTADEDGGQHRGRLLHSVTDALESMHSVAEMPKRISVFGLHILPPFFIDCLNGIAKHCDVHLFLLSPCKYYWGDMRKHRLEQDDSDAADIKHPLLASLGIQGQEFQDLLLEKISFKDEFTSYQEPENSTGQGNPSLLHRLQGGLLQGTVPRTTAAAAADGSIRIISCHTRQRELEVLKDHVLDILCKKSDLHLREIVVMAPDIQEYAPFITAVFDNIQHSIADRSLYRKNTYVALFDDFLSLIGGRFGWSEVLDLLVNDKIYPQFDLSFTDCELLHRWVVDSGIRWGLSRKTRERFGYSYSENSWQSGLERMLMGYSIDCDQDIAGILPYQNIEGGEAKALGGLCQFIDVLQHADHEFSSAMTLKQWSAALLGYCRALFGSRDDRDFLEIYNMLRDLDKSGNFNQGAVDLQTIRKWFEYSTKESRSASGFLKGHLTFCSLLPMRSIPFRAVCLLGMNYGEFPKNEHQLPFDLMKKKPYPGDRSMRADDRYQFLEAILAARESLYVSYLGQSINTNKKAPPSVVVSELNEILKKNYGVDNIVEHHPLHGFSERYFTPESSWFSYNERNFQVAEVLGRNVSNSRKWWCGTVDIENKEIALADIFRFYSDPQHYFVSRVLGVPPEDNLDITEENETFETTGLATYLAEQEILSRLIGGEDIYTMLHTLKQQGQWPLKAVGDVTFAQKSKELGGFADRISHLNMGKPCEDIKVEIEVGGHLIRGELSHIYEGGILLSRYATLKGKDLFSAWIHHQVARSSGMGDTETRLVMIDEQFVFNRDCIDGPSLEDLVSLYVDGSRRPSALFIEPGLAYCRQKTSNRASIPPLLKARRTFQKNLEDGYMPSWSVLYRHCKIEEVIAEDFVDICEKYYLPLWRGQ